MKNLIIVLIDALNVDSLGPKKYKETPSPFLDKLKAKSVVFNNVYSSAPYTEGAMLELMGGYNTLDNGGFMENLKDAPSTLFECFSKEGYDVYSSIYNYPNNEGFRRGVNYPRVMGLTYPSTLWNYRFKYYADLKKRKMLKAEDYHILVSLCEECIKDLKNDLTGLKNRTDEYSLMQNYTTSIDNINKQKEYVLKFETAFYMNKHKSIDELLDTGLNHDFFRIFNFLNWPSTMETQGIHKNIKVEYSKLIKRMSTLQQQGNCKYVGNRVKNTVSILNEIQKDCKELKFDKNKMGSRLLELSIYTNLNIRKVFQGKADALCLKDTPSAITQLNDFLNWYDHKKDENKPFLSFLHLDDLHVTPIPYSYTSNDEKLIREELDRLYKYVDTLDSDYRGNILYDAAIYNLDKKLEIFIKQLEERGALDNTTLLFTSDHGFYYTFDAFRTDSIENVHRENYHILCMMYDKTNADNQQNNGLFAQKDIAVTLLKRFDISVPQSFIGIDMAKNMGRDYNIIEYPGRGCPDLQRKTFVLAAYDLEYKVYARVKLNENLVWEHIVEIYDLKNDGYETRNIVKKAKSIDRVIYLFDRILARHTQLRVMYERSN